MKVLYSAFSCNPERGGESNYGWNWPLHLAKLGHSVCCITDARNEAVVSQHAAEYADLDLEFFYAEVPKWMEHTWKYTPGMYAYYLFWQKRAFALARKLHQSKQFDLVHHVSWTSLQLSSYMWRLETKFIFGPVGGGQFADEQFKRFFGVSWKKEAQRKKVSELLLRFYPNSKKAVQSADRVLAANLDTLALIRSIGAKQAEFFEDCALPAEFFPKEQPKREPSELFRVLWVGRLMPRKGLRLTLEALSRVDAGIPFKFTIVGDGEQADLLPIWIEELGLVGKVECVGAVEWAAVREYYAKSDLFMFCSLRDTASTQFFEAQAFGLPVLTLNIHGGVTMVDDDCGVKVDACTPEQTIIDLVSAFESLYRNPEQRMQMGVNAFNKLQNRTWVNKAARMEQIYREVVGEEAEV